LERKQNASHKISTYNLSLFDTSSLVDICLPRWMVCLNLCLTNDQGLRPLRKGKAIQLQAWTGPEGSRRLPLNIVVPPLNSSPTNCNFLFLICTLSVQLGSGVLYKLLGIKCSIENLKLFRRHACKIEGEKMKHYNQN